MPLEKRSVVRCYPGAASAAFSLLFALCSAADGRPQASQCAGIPNSPGDASLHLALKNGQSDFHQGEIIALSVDYTADTSGKYLVNNRNYDRSGRLSDEEIFCLDPERGADPLDEYFHSQQAIMGGGAFSEQDPARQPLTMDLELNEWLSLPPGSYRLTVIGNRLALGKEGGPITWRNAIIPLRSDTVEFEVQPADPDWQAAQLAGAIRVLDLPDASDADKKHAARVLRFLGSEASTRELARRYGSGMGTFDWDFRFGLYSTPYREVAIHAMKAELSDPDHPVTRDYISTLVELEMLADPKLRLPPYDPNRQEEWRHATDAYYAEVERRIDEYMQQASTAPRDAAALATTASEMLQSGLPLNPEAKTHWRQLLIANSATLPIEKQNELIEYRWAEVGGPEWLPVLQQIVDGPANPNRSLNQPNREYALLRIWQVAPEEAQPLMLQEIAKPPGDIGIGVLGLLPERTLPQFEAEWLKAIEQGGAADVVYQLFDRYGTGQTLPALQSIYEAHRGEWACFPQTAMLRYFLRVNPEYGLKELTAALALRKTTGCFRSQLSELHEFARIPQVEKLAIRQLNDPAPSAASDAALALQRYGSPAAESALWTRLEKLHQQWKDKPDELLHPQPNMIVFDSESGLEQALVQGILDGQAWFADAATVQRLKELSSPTMQSGFEGTLQKLESGEFMLNMTWWPEDELDYTLGWYSGKGMASFKEKLAQFPSGSRFRLLTTKAMQQAHQAEFAEAERAASANGQTIAVLTPR
jgi:hypothetical protein